jgi:hypothetical protein
MQATKRAGEGTHLAAGAGGDWARLGLLGSRTRLFESD